MHVRTTIPLLKAGYDLLLEKPIGVTKQEVLELSDVTTKFKRKVIFSPKRAGVNRLPSPFG